MTESPTKKRGSAIDGILDKMFSGADIRGALHSMHTDFPVVKTGNPVETVSPIIEIEPVVVAVPDSIIDPVIIKQPPVVALSKESTPLDRLTVSPSDSETVRRSFRNTVTQQDSNTVMQSYANTVIPSNAQAVLEVDPQTVSYPKTAPQTVLGYIPLDVLNLAYNQACVLEYLINNTSGITNARSISDSTHITIPSVREALQRLVVKGFMAKPVTVKSAAYQGFSYVLNKSLCDHFLNAGGLSQENYKRHQTIPQTVLGSDSLTATPYNSLTDHSSNSLLESKNLTTTSLRQTVSQSNGGTITPSDTQALTPSNGSTIRRSEGFILTGGIGAYWEEEGLGEGQAQKWCSQFEVDPEQMRMQLDWARFDLETNGRRGEVKKDPVSWFFGHLRTTGGCFPRPIDYKSPIELRAEALQMQKDRDRVARYQMEAAEFENRFQAFIADPESDLYRKLIAQLSGFAAEQLKEGDRQAAEIELRDLFDKSCRGNNAT